MRLQRRGNLKFDAIPLEAPYYGLRNVGKVVADFFNVVHQIDKYQIKFSRC